jgi:signal peptidase I
MAPTFHDGDYLIVDEISYRFKAPSRGEVIVFQYPRNPSQKFIKRIVGLPGETIELREGRVMITSASGKKTVLDESNYIPFEGRLGKTKIVLGKNEYFVLGDNRNHSFDSRNWGVLNGDLVIGKVFLRIFPPKAAAFFPAPAY